MIDGIIFNIILAFLAGILLNLTPCVLPVLPFKVKSLNNEIGGDFRSRLFAAFAVLAGTLTLFLPLGAAAAYLGFLWGELFQSKLFIGALSFILFMAALATFFGLSFRLPQIFYKMPYHRYAGAFFTGLLAGVLATPCAGPFLGSVLAYSALQYPGTVMLIFCCIATGLAFPYIVLLLFPAVIERVPRGGLLAREGRIALALILLSGALFFSRIFIPPSIFTVLLAVALISVILLASFALYRSQVQGERILPVLVLTIIAVLVVQLLAPVQEDVSWIVLKESSLDEIETKLKPGNVALIEFTADWCINCKVLERFVYSDPAVQAALINMDVIPIRFDMTDFTPAEKAALTQYGGKALPYAVLLNGSGNISATFSGMLSVTTLLDSLIAVQSDIKLESPR